jgi:hypothetical protein
MDVASTRAFLAVNSKLECVTKRTLVGMAMENEGRVGVNSGGCAIHQCQAFVMVPTKLIATGDVNSQFRTLRHIPIRI